jgi:hypothetical protein
VIPPALIFAFGFAEVVEVLEETEVVVSEDPPNIVDTRVNLSLNDDDKEFTDAIATKHTQARQRMTSATLEPAHRAYFIEFWSLNSPICYFCRLRFQSAEDSAARTCVFVRILCVIGLRENCMGVFDEAVRKIPMGLVRPFRSSQSSANERHGFG